MECLNEKIKNLYLELCYVRIEWSLFKEINSKDDVEHIYVQNEEMFLSMKDSLLYSIIMRVAKICENDTEVNSIYKVFNCCSSSSIFSKIISKSEIDLLKNNLEEKIIIEKEGKKINLIKKWRDKYFAHYSKLISTFELQKEFAISNKTMDDIIDCLYDIIETFNKKFEISINDSQTEKSLELVKKQFNFFYDNGKKFYE